MKLQTILAATALALGAATPLRAQTFTTWDNPVKVTAATGALTKSSGCEGCPDSGAHSTPRLTGDGYSEFVAPALTRFFAGLGADLSASTASSTIDFAFSLWPSGSWEIRELGIYRTEGTYAAGDRFRVAVENGAVVYRRNGKIVYTSKTAPAYPLILDVTLYALGASLTEATVVGGTTTPPPPPPPDDSGTSSPPGPYNAITDRNVYVKPALPALGPAGSSIVDPVFHTPIRRITDNMTRPGAVDRSYRTPSSPHQNSWSVSSRYFYVMGSGGIGPIPYTFDPSTGTASRIQASGTGDGGLVLKFYIEPQFSYVTDSVIYGSYNGSGSTLRTIDQYDFSTGVYTRLFDLDSIEPGLAGTYVGGIASSGGPTERVEAFFGGTSQDHHRYVVVFDRANPQNRQVIDTIASTINGQPSPVTLNFSLHHAMIDRSGRYVMLYTTSADQAAPRSAAQEYLWDLQTGGITVLGTALLPYGHDAFGYGVLVNKDCCTTTTWDAGQWQFRSLSLPAATHDLIKTLLTPKEIYLSDHTTWNNARPDRLTPVVSGLYRYGTVTSDWRAWDDEIVAIQTDAPAGTESTVWRFAHHRTNVGYDGDPTRVAFWYEPRPNVSQDGNWILFTSNWEKTLGTDSAAEAGTGARQDVFLLALTSVAPAPAPVAISATTLPAGRATLPYAASLNATGGSGVFVWSASGLPAGLAIDAASGSIAGTPASSGAFAVTFTAADGANASNAATAVLTLTINPSPVQVTTSSLGPGRATLVYGASLQATGGTGGYVWSVVSGSLPAGMALDPATGTLSGTPSSAGNAAFTVRVTDAGDATNTADAAFTLTIAPPPVALGAAALPGGRVGVAYSAGLTATGGTGVYAWSVAAGAVPPGLALDTSSGVMGGTPTAAGTYSFTVAVADVSDSANSASAAFTVTIAAEGLRIVTTSLPSGRDKVAYSASIQATGSGGAIAWAAVGLPGGLTLNTSTGTISGTPKPAGTFPVTIKATDSSNASNTASAAYTLSIAAAVKIVSPSTLPNATAGVPYSYAVLAANVIGTPKWNLQGGRLPPGMALNSSTGVISGTCSTNGTYSFNVRVKDSSTNNTLTLTLTVK